MFQIIRYLDLSFNRKLRDLTILRDNSWKCCEGNEKTLKCIDMYQYLATPSFLNTVFQILGDPASQDKDDKVISYRV